MDNNEQNAQALLEQGKTLVEQHLQSPSTDTYHDSDEFVAMIHYCLHTDNITLARSLVNLALSLHPNNLALQIRNADIYCNEDKPQAALHTLEHCADPNNIVVLIHRAIILIAADRNQEATEIYDALLPRLKQEQKEHYLPIIAKSLENKHPQLSIYYWKLAYELDPHDKKALRGYAHAAHLLGQYQQAIELLNQLIDIDPYDPLPWQDITITHICNHNLTEALNAIEYAIMLNHDGHTHHHLLNIKGDCLFACEQYNDALSIYLQLLNIDPNHKLLELKIAITYLLLNDETNAIKYYQQALKNNPQTEKDFLDLFPDEQTAQQFLNKINNQTQQ